MGRVVAAAEPASYDGTRVDAHCWCVRRLEHRARSWSLRTYGAHGLHLDADCEVIVVSERHRSQSANRDDAPEKLRKLVAEAWLPPTVRRTRSGPSKKGSRMRLEEKRKASAKKQSRTASRRGVFE